MIEPTNFAFIFCCQCLEIHHHLKALACAGIIFLLAFFIWGSLNLSSTLAGRRAVWLWGSIIAYSALLTSARVGMYLAFTVGRLYWPSQSKAGYILLLLGFSPATNNWQYVLVGFSQAKHQSSLTRPHWEAKSCGYPNGASMQCQMQFLLSMCRLVSASWRSFYLPLCGCCWLFTLSCHARVWTLLLSGTLQLSLSACQSKHCLTLGNKCRICFLPLHVWLFRLPKSTHLEDIPFPLGMRDDGGAPNMKPNTIICPTHRPPLL